VAHGPAVEHHVAGATVEIPGTYRVATPFAGQDVEDIVASGPLGATVEVARVIVPGGTASVETIARGLALGAVPLPQEVHVDPSSVVVFNLPAGPAVSTTADIAGRDGRLVIVPHGAEVFIASYRSDGNVQSSLDFDQILLSLTLPTG